MHSIFKKTIFYEPYLLVSLSKKNSIFLFFLSLISGGIQSLSILAIFPLVSLFNLFAMGEVGVLVNNFYKILYLDFFGLKNNLLSVLLFMFSAILLSSLLNYLVRYKAIVISTNISRDLKLKFISQTMKAKWSYYTSKKTGEIVNTFIIDIGRTSAGYVDSINFLSNITQSLVIIFISFTISFYITLYAIMVGFIFLLITKRWFKKAKIFGTRSSRLLQQLNIGLTEKFKNIKSFKASGKIKLVDSFFKNYAFMTQKNDIRLALTTIVPEVIKEPIFAFFLSVGIYFAITNELIEITTLLASIALFQRSLSKFSLSYSQYISIKKMIPFYNSFKKNLYQALNSEENFLGKKNAIFENYLKINNLNFSYDGKVILNNVNLIINKGDIIGIKGESGSGKTSLIDIICGLNVPKSGSILLDNNDFKDINLDNWRKKIGYVSQDQFYFNDSVLNNITLGSAFTDKNKLEEVLKISEVDKFLINHEKYSNMNIGEGGLKLSGGQRQRISIARALIFNPEIIILDEATSAMDEKTETNVMNNLIHFKDKHNLTIILISHKTSNLKICNKLYEIIDGELEKIS